MQGSTGAALHGRRPSAGHRRDGAGGAVDPAPAAGAVPEPAGVRVPVQSPAQGPRHGPETQETIILDLNHNNVHFTVYNPFEKPFLHINNIMKKPLKFENTLKPSI